MSVKEIAAIWEVLTYLESFAAGLAARRMDSEDRLLLNSFHNVSLPYLEAGDVEGYDAANKTFHEAIYRGCRNEYLAKQVMTIRRRLQPYRRFPFHRAGGMQRSFEGHQLVPNAIKTGEEDKAAAAMREHVAGGLSFLDLIAEFPARDHHSSKTKISEKADVRARLRPQPVVGGVLAAAAVKGGAGHQEALMIPLAPIERTLAFGLVASKVTSSFVMSRLPERSEPQLAEGEEPKPLTSRNPARPLG
jgi:hypothetical protein